MACVLSALRANKQLLKQNLSIFLDDPTMDWIIDSKSRQGNGGAEGSRRGGKGKGSAQSVSFLQERMNVLESKLDGVHPCNIMECELQSNPFNHIKGNPQCLQAILKRARGNPGESAGGGGFTRREGASKNDTVGSKMLDAADQVFLAFAFS